jgi:hypothetical protein
MSAQAVSLDRLLAHYGPEANPARSSLRAVLVRILEQTWSHDGNTSSLDPSMAGQEWLFDEVQNLSPQNDAQRSLRSSAISMLIELGQTRWLIYEQTVVELPRPLLTVMVLWLSLLFLSFGLLAPRNGTVAASLLLSGAAVSCAVLMTLEMYSPYQGLIQVSSAPLRAALTHLGK